MTVVTQEKHNQLRHLGDKPCECKVYGESFGDKYELIAHERIHTGQKP